MIEATCSGCGVPIAEHPITDACALVQEGPFTWELPEGALRVIGLLTAGKIEPGEARATLKRGGFAEADVYRLVTLAEGWRNEPDA